MRLHERRKTAVFAGLASVLCLAALGAVLLSGQRSVLPETRGEYTGSYNRSGTLEIGGTRYIRKAQQETVLLLGIDKTGASAGTGSRRGGQADFLRLLVIDSAEKRITELPISRDTMTDITVLDILGKPSGTRNAQICLSHAFGDGGTQSNELTMEAVSRLLLGTEIDHCAAMDLDGISVLNDWAGGVTVTIEDDLTALDASLVPGATVCLKGKQAELFVRGRMAVGDGSNASRMRRQQAYLSCLGELLQTRFSRSRNAAGELYDLLSGNLVTDMSRGRIINMVWTGKDYTRELKTIDGTTVTGSDGFSEFHPDEQALQALVLSVFYEPVQ